jgi:hypothetical protein
MSRPGLYWAPVVGMSLYVVSELATEYHFIAESALAWWPAVGPYSGHVLISLAGFGLALAVAAVAPPHEDGKLDSGRRWLLWLAYLALILACLPPVLFRASLH